MLGYADRHIFAFKTKCTAQLIHRDFTEYAYFLYSFTNCYRSVEQKRFVVGGAKYTEDMRRLHQLQIRYGIGADGGNSSARFFQLQFYTYFRELEIYNCIGENQMI